MSNCCEHGGCPECNRNALQDFAIKEAVLRAARDVRKDFNGMMTPRIKKHKLQTYRTLGDFCKARKLTKREAENE